MPKVALPSTLLGTSRRFKGVPNSLNSPALRMVGSSASVMAAASAVRRRHYADRRPLASWKTSPPRPYAAPLGGTSHARRRRPSAAPGRWRRPAGDIPGSGAPRHCPRCPCAYIRRFPDAPIRAGVLGFHLVPVAVQLLGHEHGHGGKDPLPISDWATRDGHLAVRIDGEPGADFRARGFSVQGSRAALAFGRDRASMRPPLAATLLFTKARRDRAGF